MPYGLAHTPSSRVPIDDAASESHTIVVAETPQLRATKVA